MRDNRRDLGIMTAQVRLRTLHAIDRRYRLRQQVRRIRHGREHPRVERRAIDRSCGGAVRRVGRRDASAGRLTARESEVLQLVAQGLDNGTIAARLKISDKTVRNQVSIIFDKIGVTSRAQAVAFARDAGLGRGNAR
jgi:DNA-binding NarL/FixJ family response regulator